jgi:hypothetical protein
MNGFTSKLVLGSALAAAVGFMAGSADARPVRHHPHYFPHYAAAPVYARPPLTVNKRSFLDPGPVVPVGSESNYMVQSTYFATTSDQNFARSKFGNESLPRPLEVPGRPQPVFEFETPRSPF